MLNKASKKRSSNHRYNPSGSINRMSGGMNYDYNGHKRRSLYYNDNISELKRKIRMLTNENHRLNHNVNTLLSANRDLTEKLNEAQTKLYNPKLEIMTNDSPIVVKFERLKSVSKIDSSIRSFGRPRINSDNKQKELENMYYQILMEQQRSQDNDDAKSKNNKHDKHDKHDKHGNDNINQVGNGNGVCVPVISGSGSDIGDDIGDDDIGASQELISVSGHDDFSNLSDEIHLISMTDIAATDFGNDDSNINMNKKNKNDTKGIDGIDGIDGIGGIGSMEALPSTGIILEQIASDVTMVFVEKCDDDDLKDFGDSDDVDVGKQTTIKCDANIGDIDSYIEAINVEHDKFKIHHHADGSGQTTSSLRTLSNDL